MSGRFFNLLIPWIAVTVGLTLMSGFAKAGSPMMITKADHGKVITIHKNEVIQIELEALGTAGYAWHITTLDQEYWEITFKDVVRNSAKGSSVGAPATHMWQFRAIKAGDTEIVIPYYRIWEGKDKATDVFRLKVKILSR